MSGLEGGQVVVKAAVQVQVGDTPLIRPGKRKISNGLDFVNNEDVWRDGDGK
jgi:hypothetical protein